MFKSKPSHVVRTIFSCRLSSAQQKKRKQSASGEKSKSSNDKISFATLNDDENDAYWSEEPLKDHPDTEDRKIAGTKGNFPYALGFGELGRKNKRQKQSDANDAITVVGTPATVISSPSEESTSWAAQFNRRFPSSTGNEDETNWIDTTVGKSNDAFSAQKPSLLQQKQQQPQSSNSKRPTMARDVISEMHQQHATASDSDEDIFDSSNIKVEPKRRLFGTAGPAEVPSCTRPTPTPTTIGVMDLDGNVIVSSSAALGPDNASGASRDECIDSLDQLMDGLFPIQAISPSQRDTLPRSTKRKTREQRRQRRSNRRNRRRQRNKDLVDVVSKISQKCSELQINLAEKEADIEKMRWNHEALLADLDHTSTPTGRRTAAAASNDNCCSGRAGDTRITFAHAYDNVGVDEERKILHSTLTANGKLELALKVMQDTAQEAQKTLDRTKKDHQVEVQRVRRTHQNALNEQRVAYSKALRGMQEQLTTANQQMQHLKNRNYDLEMQLDCAKAALREESAHRAQENLNHVYEMMDLTRDHEIRVAELKTEKAALSEEVEEGFLSMEEMRMSLELVKADAEYASAKLERAQRAHRDEIRSLTKESDDRFFKVMAARERECQGMNQELNCMFGKSCDDDTMQRGESRSKFD